jgi:hypothetical protein
MRSPSRFRPDESGLEGRPGRVEGVHHLKSLAGHRFIGDLRTMEVHDTWHPGCEGCLPGTIVADGAGVGFEPDELRQALMEGFECCSWCFGREDPDEPWNMANGLDWTLSDGAN